MWSVRKIGSEEHGLAVDDGAGGDPVKRLPQPRGDGNAPHRAARSLAAVQAMPTLQKRRAILAGAQLLLGDRYVWGGRSPQRVDAADQVTGVDCSGLINLVYRTVGMIIPRDAHEQFLRAKPVNALQPADLIFLSERDNPERIVHVMLYAGEGELIEGPGTGTSVRRVSVSARLGKTLDWIAPGVVVDGQTVLFGTYLPNARDTKPSGGR